MSERHTHIQHEHTHTHKQTQTQRDPHSQTHTHNLSLGQGFREVQGCSVLCPRPLAFGFKAAGFHDSRTSCRSLGFRYRHDEVSFVVLLVFVRFFTMPAGFQLGFGGHAEPRSASRSVPACRPRSLRFRSHGRRPPTPQRELEPRPEGTRIDGFGSTWRRGHVWNSFTGLARLHKELVGSRILFRVSVLEQISKCWV